MADLPGRDRVQSESTELLLMLNSARPGADQDADTEPSTATSNLKLTRLPHRIRTCTSSPLWPTGWRFTVSAACFASLFVLAFNLGFILWAVTHHTLVKNRGVLYDGNCDKVKSLSVGFHLVINILSTVLLGASNYCMQCLCAPTRKDIDKAHEEGQWLDIGMPSIRNLGMVSRRRTTLWVCLVLSSLPLHLMYNSTIFSTISANAYRAFAGSESLIQKGGPVRDQLGQDVASDVVPSLATLVDRANNGSLERLESSACVDAYATSYQRKRGGVLVVLEEAKETQRYRFLRTEEVLDPWRHKLAYEPQEDPYWWLCDAERPEHPQRYNGHDCSYYLESVRKKVAGGEWKMRITDGSGNQSSHRVRYCLSERAAQHCKLQYSLPLSVTVIVFNIVKAIIMCYVAITTTASPILTTGDAISSFIRRPDPFTYGECLLSRHDLERPWDLPTGGARYAQLTFDKKPKRWCTAVPGGRWAFGILFYVIAIVTCIALLAYGFSQMSSTKGVWSAGLQALSTQTLITGTDWPTTLASNTMIANIPQLIYSRLYFGLNAIITAMTLAAEWSSYALHRKGLRVSGEPKRSQRSSYFLSLPYRYSIPLVGLSAVLHWLISQSLFLVGIDAYAVDGKRGPLERDLTTCGYSPAAIVASISVGTGLLVCVIALGFKRFKSGMPVAGGCSRAIAAACHPKPVPIGEEREPETKPGAEYMSLKWGAVYLDGIVGHCFFSPDEVDMPEDGRVYW